MVYILSYLYLAIIIFRRKNKYITIHIDIFLIATLYYYFSPIIIYEGGFFFNENSMDTWRATMSALYQKQQVNSLLIYIFAMLLAFLAGDFLGKKITITKRNIGISKNGLNLFTPVLLWALITAITLSRAFWFSGYSGNFSFEGNALLAGAVMMSCLLILIRLTKNKFKLVDFWLIFIIYLAGIIFLVGMGMRIYVITTLASFFFMFFLTKEGHIKITKYIIFIASSISILILIGIWRNSSNSTQSEPLLFHFFTESIYTSYSWVSFWERNSNISLFNFGDTFVAGLINLTPSIFFTDRSQYLNYDLGYTYYAPVGALGNVANFVANFGYIGSLLYLGLTGFLYRIVFNSINYTILMRAIYSYHCGILLFLFFRDVFSTTLKVQLLVGVAIPILLINAFGEEATSDK